MNMIIVKTIQLAGIIGLCVLAYQMIRFFGIARQIAKTPGNIIALYMLMR